MRNETVSQESPERAEIGRINHESKARKSPGKNREDVERHRLRKRREAFVLDFNALVVRLTEEGKQRLMDRLYEIPPVRLIRPRRGIRSRPGLFSVVLDEIVNREDDLAELVSRPISRGRILPDLLPLHRLAVQAYEADRERNRRPVVAPRARAAATARQRVLERILADYALPPTPRVASRCAPLPGLLEQHLGLAALMSSWEVAA